MSGGAVTAPSNPRRRDGNLSHHSTSGTYQHWDSVSVSSSVKWEFNLSYSPPRALGGWGRNEPESVTKTHFLKRQSGKICIVMDITFSISAPVESSVQGWTCFLQKLWDSGVPAPKEWGTGLQELEEGTSGSSKVSVMWLWFQACERRWLRKGSGLTKGLGAGCWDLRWNSAFLKFWSLTLFSFKSLLPISCYSYSSWL